MGKLKLSDQQKDFFLGLLEEAEKRQKLKLMETTSPASIETPATKNRKP